MEFNDVYGLDDELLEMVPKPVLAVIFLYPYTTQVILVLISFFFWFFGTRISC